MECFEVRSFPIEKFESPRRLGVGSFGVVYELVEKPDCNDQSLPSRIAIKKFRVNLTQVEEDLKRFDEMIILQQLSHPNVIYFYGLCTFRGTAAFAMELCDGDLLEMLSYGTKFNPEEIRFIAREVSHGLQYLHHKGIIHRDLKPANVLYKKENPNTTHEDVIIQQLQIKICDMGMSKHVGHLSIPTAMSCCGTPRYMPPEIRIGIKKGRGRNRCLYDLKADIYSFGLLLCHLYAGHDFFQQNDFEEDYEQEHKALILFTKSNENIYNIVKRCMAKSPADRPDSISLILERYIKKPGSSRNRLSACDLDGEKSKQLDDRHQLKHLKNLWKTIDANHFKLGIRNVHIAKNGYLILTDTQSHLHVFDLATCGCKKIKVLDTNLKAPISKIASNDTILACIGKFDPFVRTFGLPTLTPNFTIDLKDGPANDILLNNDWFVIQHCGFTEVFDSICHHEAEVTISSSSCNSVSLHQSLLLVLNQKYELEVWNLTTRVLEHSISFPLPENDVIGMMDITADDIFVVTSNFKESLTKIWTCSHNGQNLSSIFSSDLTQSNIEQYPLGVISCLTSNTMSTVKSNFCWPFWCLLRSYLLRCRKIGPWRTLEVVHFQEVAAKIMESFK